MERIQEAIAKARKNRDNNRIESSLVQNNPQNKPVYKSHHGAISIDYSHTRVIQLSDQELKARKIVAGLAHDDRSEPYRQLRTQVLKKMREDNLRTLAVTSPNEGSGKTLTAVNLAISLSKEVNQTVMLVDLDLRRPSIARLFGLDDIEVGIVDTIFNDVALDTILFNPGYDRLVVAPGTPQGQHTSEILSSPGMRRLQQELYSRYTDRIIIYDLPALLTSDDALVFAPHADATLLVVADGGAEKRELEKSVALLKDTNLLGTVINKLR